MFYIYRDKEEEVITVSVKKKVRGIYNIYTHTGNPG